MSREVGKDKKVWSVRRGACGGRSAETKGVKVKEGWVCEGGGEDEEITALIKKVRQHMRDGEAVIQIRPRTKTKRLIG